MQPTRQIYERAADRLETFGWCQRRMREREDTFDCPMCVIGALLFSSYGDVSFRHGWSKILRPLEEKTGVSGLGGLWNDLPEQTAANVIAIVREVAKTLPEAA